MGLLTALLAVLTLYICSKSTHAFCAESDPRNIHEYSYLCYTPCGALYDEKSVKRYLTPASKAQCCKPRKRYCGNGNASEVKTCVFYKDHKIDYDKLVELPSLSYLRDITDVIDGINTAEKSVMPGIFSLSTSPSDLAAVDAVIAEFPSRLQVNVNALNPGVMPAYVVSTWAGGVFWVLADGAVTSCWAAPCLDGHRSFDGTYGPPGTPQPFPFPATPATPPPVPSPAPPLPQPIPFPAPPLPQPVPFPAPPLPQPVPPLGPQEPEPNPPSWPSSVIVFAPGDTSIQKTINDAYALLGRSSTGSNSISWNSDGSVFWALACDFSPGSDQGNASMPGEQCGPACVAQPNCTHFTWLSDICYFKGGSVSSGDAIASSKPGIMCGIVSADNQAYGNGHFSSLRTAFLFKPGSYAEDVPLGYYTTVHGLGSTPDSVVFTGAKGVFVENGSPVPAVGALNNFWRGAENFKTLASHSWWSGAPPGMLWAVSQAAPLRRVEVANNLVLFQYEPPAAIAGFASGGFMANVQVIGSVVSGSQQQWMTRNSQLAQWINGVWNMVFVGSLGAPASNCGLTGSGTPYVTVLFTPLVAEKPYITIDAQGLYWLKVPRAVRSSRGVDYSETNVDSVSFAQVYVSQPGDSAAKLNAKLAAGLHLLISPGIYNLETSLIVTKNNQVILGLGMATLVSAIGQAVITVVATEGVRLAGLMLQSGPTAARVLLQWGLTKQPGNSSNPGFLHDVFVRVGGPNPVEDEGGASIMLEINTGYVVGDNIWLWRADHFVGGLVTNSACPCTNGLVVNADNVIMYGLAVEHTLGDQVVWNGEGGQTYFFQSEFPYDVTQDNFGSKSFVGYRVAPEVKDHDVYGAGVYHFFRDYPVVVETAISVPDALVSRFRSPLIVFLNGLGTVKHIINSLGMATARKDAGANPAWFCP